MPASAQPAASNPSAAQSTAPQSVSAPIRIEAWIDFVCPWSSVGMRNLLQGVRQFTGAHPDIRVQIGLRSYELNPDASDDDSRTAAQQVAEVKGLPVQQAEDELAQIASVAADAGLVFDFDRLQQAHTALAHELLHAARIDHREQEVAESLFAAHFTQGRHIGRIDTLEAIAAEQGLDVASVSRELATHAHAAEVQTDERRAAELGISAVPFFLLNGRFGVSGAQPVETFAEVLAEVSAELHRV